MVVNEVRDFAISLHKNGHKFDNTTIEEHLYRYLCGRVEFVTGYLPDSCVKADNLSKYFPANDLQYHSGIAASFRDTSFLIKGMIDAKEHPPFASFLSSLISGLNSGCSLFELDRRSVYLNSFSDGQLLAIYWYLLGH